MIRFAREASSRTSMDSWAQGPIASFFDEAPREKISLPTLPAVARRTTLLLAWTATTRAVRAPRHSPTSAPARGRARARWPRSTGGGPVRADGTLPEQQSRLIARAVRTDPGAPIRAPRHAPAGARLKPKFISRIPHIKHGARSSVAACCGDGETNDHTGGGRPTPRGAREAARRGRPHQLHANYAFFLETKKRSSARTRP